MSTHVSSWKCNFCGKFYDDEEKADECCLSRIEFIAITNRSLKLTIRSSIEGICVEAIYQLHLKYDGEDIILLLKDDADDLALIKIILAPDWFMDMIKKKDNEFIEALSGEYTKYEHLFGSFEISVNIPNDLVTVIPGVDNRTN